MLLASPETLDLDKIVSLVTGFIARDVATYIDVPVGSGLQHARGFVNDLLGPSIAARDRVKADELVRAAIGKLQAMAPSDMTA